MGASTESHNKHYEEVVCPDGGEEGSEEPERSGMLLEHDPQNQ